MSGTTRPVEVTEAAVLADVTAMIAEVLDGYGLDDAEVTMDTTFHGDLEMESIDLVSLGGHLTERYGSRVNLAEFVADLELDEIIGLTVGRLVRYVVASLRAAGAA